MDLTAGSQKEVDEAEEKKNLKKIEAALFVSARFLEVKELVGLTDVNPLMIQELLLKLKESYELNDSAIEIIHKDDLWKMDLKQEYFNLINKLATGDAEFTRAEQETLAIIAYKQPVKQSVIIKIRGNKAYEHIKNFLDMGLVKSKRAGHTLDLSLSEGFYDYFHVEKKKKESGNGEESENST